MEKVLAPIAVVLWIFRRILQRLLVASVRSLALFFVFSSLDIYFETEVFLRIFLFKIFIHKAYGCLWAFLRRSKKFDFAPERFRGQHPFISSAINIIVLQNNIEPFFPIL